MKKYQLNFLSAIKVFFILHSIYPLNYCSQNLITNGGFDSITGCPNRISQIKLASGWLSSGSPDLFCTCSQTKSSVYAGLSFVGSLPPYSGYCYSGFIVNDRYKEYLTVKLPKKTRKRAIYCIRFLYSRSAFSGIKVDSLGIYLHKKMYRNAVNGQPMQKKTAAVRIEDSPGKWSATSFTFVCGGGEHFITIGSFGKDLKKIEHLPANKNKKNVRIFNYSRSAYYFIEDVELIQLRKGETCLALSLPNNTVATLPVITEQLVEKADSVSYLKPFVLQQLNFETAKSDILPSSFDELDELADYLISQPELNLLIVGHTDNLGSEKKNTELSMARAREVADYLASKGIIRERLNWKGFGSSRPVASNANEEGRMKNRRVEFQFK